LIVIAILAILAALLLPVLVRSREKAKDTTEISNMHQMAIAGTLYHDENGAWPLSVAPLVQQRLAPSNVSISPLDLSENGMANDLAALLATQCPACDVAPTPYRRTFLGPDDFGHSDDTFAKQIEPTNGAGWLISLTESQSSQKNSPMGRFTSPMGSYHRVLLGGSVVVRKHYKYVTPTGSYYAMQFMFADGDDAWRASIVTDK
jgi:type II secretory pathway pseudopilin PulG